MTIHDNDEWDPEESHSVNIGGVLVPGVAPDPATSQKLVQAGVADGTMRIIRS